MSVRSSLGVQARPLAPGARVDLRARVSSVAIALRWSQGRAWQELRGAGERASKRLLPPPQPPCTHNRSALFWGAHSERRDAPRRSQASTTGETHRLTRTQQPAAADAGAAEVGPAANRAARAAPAARAGRAGAATPCGRATAAREEVAESSDIVRMSRCGDQGKCGEMGGELNGRGRGAEKRRGVVGEGRVGALLASSPPPPPPFCCLRSSSQTTRDQLKAGLSVLCVMQVLQKNPAKRRAGKIKSKNTERGATDARRPSVLFPILIILAAACAASAAAAAAAAPAPAPAPPPAAPPAPPPPARRSSRWPSARRTPR